MYRFADGSERSFPSPVRSPINYRSPSEESPKPVDTDGDPSAHISGVGADSLFQEEPPYTWDEGDDSVIDNPTADGDIPTGGTFLPFPYH